MYSEVTPSLSSTEEKADLPSYGVIPEGWLHGCVLEKVLKSSALACQPRVSLASNLDPVLNVLFLK